MKYILSLLFMITFLACQPGNKETKGENTNDVVTEVVEANINISGMHCDNCVASVEKGINELKGIASVKVSLSDSNAVVKYDASKLKLDDIEKAIEKRGYTVK